MVGPRNVQALVLDQLFNRDGRWYLIDDGDCHTYLESPHTRIALDRLVLRAHLSSRFGQQMGNTCVGADFASNVTLSGKLRGSGHFLILDDIRIDRVDDESARSALDLALKVEPQLIPRAAKIDLTEFVTKDALTAAGSSARLDETGFHCHSIRLKHERALAPMEWSCGALSNIVLKKCRRRYHSEKSRVWVFAF